MIRVAYFSTGSSQVTSLVYAPSLDLISPPEVGVTAVITDYYGPMPAYWTGSVVLPLPAQPSPSHVWSWVTNTWNFDLDAARDDAWERVKARRDQISDADYTWDGSVFQADPTSRQKIAVAAQAAREAIAAGDSISFLWTLADNSTRTLTATNMLAVFRGAVGRAETASYEATGKRAEIAVATTQAALDDIVARVTPVPPPVA